MRRALGALTVLAFIAVTPAALAVSEWENYKDTFSSGGYSGNDGSLNWNGSWKEVGESNGPESGAVRVEGSGCSGQCLVIDAGLLGVATGAYRLADTGDFTDAKLRYKVAFDGGLLGLNATLTVGVTSNGGASWSTVDSILLGSGSGTQSRSVDVTGFRDEQFGIRFTATGAAGAKVSIDDVEVAGNVPLATTTTTTTSTTSTTTTTTTLPQLTTTTLPKLTTTLPSLITTTTTVPTTTTSPTSNTTTEGDDGSGANVTTTTTVVAAGTDGGPDDPGGGNDGSNEGSGSSERTSGLRQTSVGVGGNFDTGLFGSTQPEVLGFEISAGFSDAVELVEASWIWVLALALLIAGALIKGIDRRVSAPVVAAQKTGG